MSRHIRSALVLGLVLALPSIAWSEGKALREARQAAAAVMKGDQQEVILPNGLAVRKATAFEPGQVPAGADIVVLSPLRKLKPGTPLPKDFEGAVLRRGITPVLRAFKVEEGGKLRLLDTMILDLGRVRQFTGGKATIYNSIGYNQSGRTDVKVMHYGSKAPKGQFQSAIPAVELSAKTTSALDPHAKPGQPSIRYFYHGSSPKA